LDPELDRRLVSIFRLISSQLSQSLVQALAEAAAQGKNVLQDNYDNDSASYWQTPSRGRVDSQFSETPYSTPFDCPPVTPQPVPPSQFHVQPGLYVSSPVTSQHLSLHAPLYRQFMFPTVTPPPSVRNMLKYAFDDTLPPAGMLKCVIDDATPPTSVRMHDMCVM
jgi:hypothetical protein